MEFQKILKQLKPLKNIQAYFTISKLLAFTNSIMNTDKGSRSLISKGKWHKLSIPKLTVALANHAYSPALHLYA